LSFFLREREKKTGWGGGKGAWRGEEVDEPEIDEEKKGEPEDGEVPFQLHGNKHHHGVVNKAEVEGGH